MLHDTRVVNVRGRCVWRRALVEQPLASRAGFPVMVSGFTEKYDVVVVGAGHAWCEAA